MMPLAGWPTGGYDSRNQEGLTFGPVGLPYFSHRAIAVIRFLRSTRFYTPGGDAAEPGLAGFRTHPRH